MKTSIVVPLLGEAQDPAALLRALAGVLKRTKGAELLFVGQGATLERAREARLPGARVLADEHRSQAEPLNKALSEAQGELVLFLGADSIPEPGWADAMVRALGEADLVVGHTSPAPAGRKPTAHGRLAAKLFHRHSERTAHARGHALPWGPVSNLGARRALVEKTGPFSPEAASAHDIDWCWRALLKGARIAHVPGAKARQLRSGDRRRLLEEFEGYGIGETWLHRTYAFLLDPEDRTPDPLLASVAAFQRLRLHSEASRVKALLGPLEEVAASFAGGVRLGYDRPHRECPLERVAPERVIWWRNGAKEITAFVPGRGVASFTGKLLRLFEALEAGAGDEDLATLFVKLYGGHRAEALHEVEAFRSSLEPGSGE